MAYSTEKGIFISFEGIDGSGKSTQMAIAAKYIRGKGFDVITTREPGGTKLAEKIRDILLDNALGGRVTPMAELLLYLASRHQHSEETIVPHLNSGSVVLTDRYADSSTAYQGGGRGLGLDLVEGLNELVIPRWPDLTIIIDVPIEIGLSRMGNRRPDRLEEEGTNFLKAVRAAYLEIAGRHTERIVVVDGSGNIEKTSAQVIFTIERFLAGINRIGISGG
ncbi:dTMP kinase [bacterium]|nr:MAG: dTMP kinase [bacterium]